MTHRGKRSGLSLHSILFLNAHGIRTALASTPQLAHHSIAFFSETWDPTSSPLITDKDFFSVAATKPPGRGRPYGGLHMYVNPKLNAKLLSSNDSHISIQLKNISIIGFYFRPGTDLDDILISLATELNNVPSDQPTILGGDLNLHPDSSNFKEIRHNHLIKLFNLFNIQYSIFNILQKCVHTFPQKSSQKSSRKAWFTHHLRSLRSNCLHLRHLSTLDPSFTRDYCVARTAYHKGTPQGDPLSPLLFSLFLADLPNYLESDGLLLPNTSIKIHHLMYADDLVLLAEDAKQLQSTLNSLSNYCQQFRLTINIEKSKLLVHSAINDIVKSALGIAGFPSQLEPFGLDRGDGKRPGGLTTFPYKMRKSMVWDITVVLRTIEIILVGHQVKLSSLKYRASKIKIIMLTSTKATYSRLFYEIRYLYDIL
ncbi:hypothetical protein GQR58_027787 [Nymphon striatum]|nr:hypothetical protein GQR58_027787 [Nymphon striatum]